MERSVIFCIKIEKEYGGFAAASNFIHKMEKDMGGITLEEVRGITTAICKTKDFDSKDYKQLLQWTEENINRFKEIKYPEKLYLDQDRIYYLEADENSIDDVTELQYFILLQRCCTAPLVLRLAGSDSFYHKVSHYLYSIMSGNAKCYDSVLFKDRKNNLKRLQLKNIGFLRGFFPLQMINADSVRIIARPMGSFLHEDDFEHMMTENYTGIVEKVPLELRGSIAIWNSCKEFFHSQEIESIYEKLRSYSVLTFLLMSYSLRDMKKDEKDTINWSHYLNQIHEYAQGIHQLIENIIQHSDLGMGVLSIRIHKNISYIAEKYGERLRGNIPYLEIAVTDYSPENRCGNIADTFRKALETQEERREFADIQPVDFFLGRHDDSSERGRRVQELFDEYYSKDENIRRHYGLQIFKNIVEKNNGIFACYSHRTHRCGAGEEYGMASNGLFQSMVQVPGTGYRILLPLAGSASEIKRADTNIESLIDTEERAKDYIHEFKCAQMDLTTADIEMDTREKKQECIQALSKQLGQCTVDADAKRTVYYIDCSEMQGRYGEYLCKAILTSELRCELPDFVLYQCEESLVENFCNSMTVYFKRNIGCSLQKNDYAIILYTAERVRETIIFPNNYEKTYLLNKISSFARGNCHDLSWLRLEGIYPQYEDKKIEQIPYDILFPVKYGGEQMTIFENYTWHVLETDIQEKVFGCKITNTHMRLGSTIHIDSFYEAELLFSNKMFISRFAFLLVKQIETELKELKNHLKITLYSYALYSEQFIFEVMNILKKLHPEKDFDYAILEREAEHRDYSHIDRIRYNKNFVSEEERNLYFSDRMLITVVPIETTLKTHTKLLELFERANSSFRRSQILENYALILVGSRKENNYWKKADGQERIIKNGTETSQTRYPIQVKYMVEVQVDYQEALDCDKCFPRQPLNERPLIEVNAASTIPNQAFGLYQKVEKSEYTYVFLKEEEKKLRVLEDFTMYSHLKRGENHYLYYLKTDEFFLAQKEKIEEWLKNLNIEVNPQEYHILFSPAHFSNVGFLEYVNKYVFHDAALIIRTDVDKEYRGNMAAKYSNLKVLLNYLEQDEAENKTIRIYYVDDSIITGRTYFRSKSILSTTIGIYGNERKNVDIRLFDKIFVLFDRNSNQSIMQYLNDSNSADAVNNQFFAYLQLHISSLRNHGNSCIICQLERDADRLYRMSATRPMVEYWKRTRKKFAVGSLEDKQSEIILEEEEKREKDKEQRIKQRQKAFRRLYCTHMAGTVLCDKYYGNKSEYAMREILKLLRTDYIGRSAEHGREEALEYFFSYLKVISRPFVVFNKSIKEAIFDILLIISELLLDEERRDIKSILRLADEKRYLLQFEPLFQELRMEVLDKLSTDEEKTDILLLLVKQLTELKSNYFIRREVVCKIQGFIKDFPEEMKHNFYERYLRCVKRLLEINSDTSKSAWFNEEMNLLIQERGWKNLPFPQIVVSRLIIENTRAYYNGIDRLRGEKEIAFGDIYSDKDVWKRSDTVSGLILGRIGEGAYRDFAKTLLDDGFLAYGKAISWKTDEDFRAVAANVQMLRELHNAEDNSGKENVLQVCAKIAILMRYIFKAAKVQMMIEIPLECDEWREQLKEQYNSLAYEYGGKEVFEKSRLKAEKRSDYLLLANGDTLDGAGAYVEAKAVECFRKYRGERRELGFAINQEGKYLIWEFGKKSEHQVFLYAKWETEILPDFLKEIRHAMSNYYDLNEMLSKSARARIHELLLAGKDNLVYNQEKAYTHTSSNVRMSQFSDLRSHNGGKRLSDSHVITLLADLTVSHVYRQSLKKEYYNMQYLGYQWVKSKEFFTLYHTCACFYSIDLINKGYIRVEVTRQIDVGLKKFGIQEIAETDEIACRGVANARMDLQLLIHAIVLNATGVGRGKGEVVKDDEIRKGDAYVEKRVVYLAKTADGCLRIMNETNKKNENNEKNENNKENKTNIPVEEINSSLKYPPSI